MKIDVERDTWRHIFTRHDVPYRDICLSPRLLIDMSNCWQSESLQVSVLDHGLLVWKIFLKIYHGNWGYLKIPDTIRDVKGWVHAISYVHDLQHIKRYAIYHDCGKPYCMIKDEEGKVHFPDHAAASQMTYRQTFPDDPQIISGLIGLDMVVHTKKKDEIIAMELSRKTLYTLLLVGLAEVNANATMFGGYDSTSFKIKYKKLCSRFKQFIQPNIKS